MVTGDRPWFAARGSEFGYRNYLLAAHCGSQFLQKNFKFSEEFSNVLFKVLEPDPAKRTTVEELAEEVDKISTFYGPSPEKAETQSGRSSESRTANNSPVDGADKEGKEVADKRSMSVKSLNPCCCVMN